MSNHFYLSDPARIALVADAIVIWMKNNGIELHEINRALCLLANQAKAAAQGREAH